MKTVMDSSSLCAALSPLLGSLAGSTGVVVAVIVITYLAYRWALPRPLAGIPYDSEAAKSISGNLSDIRAHMKKHGRLRLWISWLPRRLKSPIAQFWIGPLSKPVVILADFRESYNIVTRRTKEFEHSQRLLDIFQATGPDHHLSMQSHDSRFKGNKELVRDLMSPSFLNEVSAPQIYEKTQNLIELWNIKAGLSKGRPFAARRDIFDAALDMVNAAAFALDDSLAAIKIQLASLRAKGEIHPYEDPSGGIEFPRDFDYGRIGVFKVATDFTNALFRSVSPKHNGIYTKWFSPYIRRNLSEKDNLIKEQIAAGLKRLNAGDQTQLSAVDQVLQREVSLAEKEGRKPNLYSRRIIDELYGYIIAGHETTSSAITWLAKLIADDQQCQLKLREALQSAFPAAVAEKRQPRAEEIVKASIPYLDAVIEEALRCRPPFTVIPRQAAQDTVVLGHHIPKGTQFFIDISGASLLEPPFPVDESARWGAAAKTNRTNDWDPEDVALFRPERWLKTGDKGGVYYDSQAGPFMSFSYGPRSCFGKRLAYLELRMVLALLTWNFHFNKIEGNLSSYEAVDGLTSVPKFCYVALDRLQDETTV